MYGILFDLDGTLVETEGLKAQAHSAAASLVGWEVVPSSRYGPLMGRPHEEVRSVFLGACAVNFTDELKLIREYDTEFRVVYQGLLADGLRVTPGAAVLVDRLYRDGYKLGVVSSSGSKTIEHVLGRVGLRRFFEFIVSKDDVDRKKPDPQSYLIGIDRMGLPPSSIIVVEDSECGIEAAYRAKLKVIALRHELNVSHNFDRAAVVVDSLESDCFECRLAALLSL